MEAEAARGVTPWRYGVACLPRLVPGYPRLAGTGDADAVAQFISAEQGARIRRLLRRIETEERPGDGHPSGG
jgi:hypothetical protein